jgi:hypothetical protein
MPAFRTFNGICGHLWYEKSFLYYEAKNKFAARFDYDGKIRREQSPAALKMSLTKT